MRKILVGCILLISASSHSSADVLSTLEQLEVNFKQLEAEETAMYNQRKAEKALISLREKYQKLLGTEKYIIDVEPYRYYQKDYKELLKKCREEKEEVKKEIEEKEEIINIYQAIMQRKYMEKREKELQKYRLYGCHFTKREYTFIQNKLKEFQEINGQRRNNTQILIGLFKLALRDKNEMKGQKL